MTDREWLKDYDNWPSWPYAPVKRYNQNDMECGLICVDRLTEVVILNLYRDWNASEYAAAKRYKYKSLDELLADGWQVD